MRKAKVREKLILFINPLLSWNSDQAAHYVTHMLLTLLGWSCKGTALGKAKELLSFIRAQYKGEDLISTLQLSNKSGFTNVCIVAWVAPRMHLENVDKNKNPHLHSTSRALGNNST